PSAPTKWRIRAAPEGGQSRLPQRMTWRTDLARLCPRGQAANSDSVGKGAQRSAPRTPLYATHLCPPYKRSQLVETCFRRSPRQPRHDLHMGRITELVDRRHLAEAIAAIDQYFDVAREGDGIARHRHDDGNAALCEFVRLRFGALARRIEHHGVEA